MLCSGPCSRSSLVRYVYFGIFAPNARVRPRVVLRQRRPPHDPVRTRLPPRNPRLCFFGSGLAVGFGQPLVQYENLSIRG